jgi:eukaryotic-like serine/threonine-protein kinase
MASEQLDEKAIFNIARQIESPDARATYLQQVCGADSPARVRVETLLRSYEEQASFLETPPADSSISPTFVPEIAEKSASQIGHYKLLQQIGEGGMGTVYLAEQTEPVQRRVALKVIKSGMDSTVVQCL